MKITVTRSGGIAGSITTASIDTDDLAPHQADAIKSIVARVSAAPDRGTMMPDAFQYDVSIDDKQSPETMRFHGDPCPATALYAAIRSLSK